MTFFRNSSRGDVVSSLSLFLISLPLTAGIAVASKVSPEAGLFSAIFGAIIVGFFSSSELIVYGPAAGLSIFISAANLRWGDSGDVSAAISMTGIILLLICFSPVHKIIHLFPSSVTKGMASGIGLILILKMIPHLFGHDEVYLSSDTFYQNDGRNTLTEIINAIQNPSMGPMIISGICLLLWFAWQKLNKEVRSLSIVVILVILGSVLASWLGNINSDWALSYSQMLHIDSLQFKFRPFWEAQIHWKESIKLAFILTSVIILEGLATLEVMTTSLDPKHRMIQPRREIFLIGISNLLMGFINALPLMPVLIRSTANKDFGATSRLSVILHGFLLLIALIFYKVFSFIPMATVAVILLGVGFNLFNRKLWVEMYDKGMAQFVPFATTVVLMLTMDFLWGLLAGFMIGLLLTMRSSLKRTMVMVEDGDRYLLRFFKDVTFIHKIELIEMLNTVPVGKEVLINGTGNILVDPDIEEWLENYQEDCKRRDCKVTFVKSNLSVSRLFKE